MSRDTRDPLTTLLDIHSEHEKLSTVPSHATHCGWRLAPAGHADNGTDGNRCREPLVIILNKSERRYSKAISVGLHRRNGWRILIFVPPSPNQEKYYSKVLKL